MQTSTFSLPFPPYEPQQQLMDAILRHGESTSFLSHPCGRSTTGCGKTIALLSAALQFRHRLSLASKSDVDQFFALAVAALIVKDDCVQKERH